MAKTEKKKTPQIKYPCLVEVVFEMKWKLEAMDNVVPQPQGQVNLSAYDPVYFTAASAFEKEAKRMGFKHRKDINPMIPHVVIHRHYPDNNKKFPLLQIGQGIFAANEDASTYEWKKFKINILRALKAIINNAGKVKITPIQIELRYINLFDPAYLSSKNNISFSKFINNETMMEFALPDFTFSNLLKPREDGRMIIQREVSSLPQTLFIFDLASVKKEGSVESLRLESKIITGNTQKEIAYRGKLIDFIDNWLDGARPILSPFFREFITQDLRDKLEGKKSEANKKTDKKKK